MLKLRGWRKSARHLSNKINPTLKSAKFIDAIKSLTGGIAYFDKDGRMVFCNENYRLARPGLENFTQPGMRFIDFLRERPKKGMMDADQARDEAWISERMKTHLNPGCPLQRRLDNGRIIQLDEYKTNDGGIVLLRTDITNTIKY